MAAGGALAVEAQRGERVGMVERFADDYLSGRTPIPCITCNTGPKFTDLLGMARDLGADCLATGHYVRRVATATGPELHRAADPARDQSYFLYGTTSEQLEFLRFPLGGLPKSDVRRIAAALDLAVAGKPDSQDICFVPDGDYAKVVEKVRPGATSPGEIVDLASGAVLGHHRGIIHFTVGQRKGLGVATGEPLFVIRLDAASRQVVVSEKRPSYCVITRALCAPRFCPKPSVFDSCTPAKVFEESSAGLEEAGFENPRQLEAPAPSPLVLANRPSKG